LRECFPDYITTVYCENKECSFDLGKTTMGQAVFQISMDGGYVQFDGKGGLITECPSCHEDTLKFD
jgi:hypothetical protein